MQQILLKFGWSNDVYKIKQELNNKVYVIQNIDDNYKTLFSQENLLKNENISSKFSFENLFGYLTDYLTPNEYLYFTSGMQYIDELPNKFQQFLIKIPSQYKELCISRI